MKKIQKTDSEKKRVIIAIQEEVDRVCDFLTVRVEIEGKDLIELMPLILNDPISPIGDTIREWLCDGLNTENQKYFVD